MPHIIDPGPAIEARVAAETADLREALRTETRRWSRIKLRWRIHRTASQIRHGMRRGTAW